MRKFNLRDGYLAPHPGDESDGPGRTIRPEPMHLAEPGCTQRNWAQSEFVQRRECDVEDEELRAAREWLAHVEAGRIGAPSA